MQLARPVRAVVLGASIATAAAVLPFAATAAHADVTGFTLSGGFPAAVGIGADPSSFTATATNSTETDETGVSYDFNIDTTNDPTLTPADLVLTYDDGSGPAVVPVTDNTGTIYNGQPGFDYHVPTGGFTLAGGGSNTGTFTLSFTSDAPQGSIDDYFNLDQFNSDGSFNQTLVSSPVTTTDIAYAKPVVNGVDPATGTQDGNTSLDITGTGFTAATAVTIGGVDATAFSVVSDDEITATTPASDDYGTPVDVTVTGPGGMGTDSGAFTYTSGAPTVSGISPNSGSESGGDPVTITGTNFTTATGAEIDGEALADFAVTSATTITGTTPADDTTGAVDVSVTNPDGTGKDVGAFTYVSNRPTVTGLSPSSGYSSGGTRVTITGSDLDASEVYFEPTQGENEFNEEATIVSSSPTQIVVLSPQEPAGTANVVIDDNGTNLAAGTFTYLATVPVIAVQGKNNSSMYVSANGGPFVSYGGGHQGRPVGGQRQRPQLLLRARQQQRSLRAHGQDGLHAPPPERGAGLRHGSGGDARGRQHLRRRLRRQQREALHRGRHAADHR